ncbi:MAG: glycan-binding surface protein [Bacteroidota bacterium]
MLPYRNIRITWLLLLSVGLLFQFACKKESLSSNPPKINQLRAISPAPNDSVLTAALPGQYLVIQGSNLRSAHSISFNGFPATFNPGIFSDENLVVAVPLIAWDSIPAGKLNILEVTTAGGTASYTFTVTAPVPSVSAISNENAVAGQEITISGSDFYGITKVTFPGGKDVTTIKANSSKSLTLTVPDGVGSGPVQITGAYGSGLSTIIFNNHVAPAVGFLANFTDGDPYFGWQWWGGNKTGDASIFPNNTGNYIQVHPPSAIGPNNGGWYADNRAVMVDKKEWLPNANLSDPISNYALKFEISVKEPWKNGAFMIVPNGNFNFMARYAPWETSATKEYTTNGTWQTVVIPLTKFLSGTGSYNASGAPAASIGGLTGGTNAASMQFMLYNDSATPLESFNAAIDNVRIVKLN